MTVTNAPQVDSSADFREYVFSEEWKSHKGPDFDEYRRLWHDVPASCQDLGYPLNLDIETTDICNLSCPGCPRTVMAENDQLTMRRMSREEYARLIDQAVEMGVKATKLMYNGEPLAHKDVIWQVEYAKNRGILDVIMNSNATLLRQDTAEGLLKAGLDGIFFSIDAASPDVYEQRRIGARFGQVIDNIHNFIKLRNQLRPSCRTRISMVMFEGEEWRDQFNALRVMWGGLVDSIGYSVATDYEDRSVRTPVPGWRCSQPFQRMVLKINGNVTVCCPDTWDELKIGDWRETPLKDLWNSDAAKAIRKAHAEGAYHSVDRCARCSYPFLEKAV
ncbi:radical SAM/SPASM domain-containing protein [Magnetospirillum aberrantis]|uniref:Radical SAM protein n=1 Tax=Magnetospirillum aberrantis SpK TaxID=908842 RepID=A0A7C9QR54_9PROT|nr:radical SAM protein [Magnetospirillum aberrantis]NFV78565.1 radical SAM protein [Magnetospirillum aberrantis SpK]